MRAVFVARHVMRVRLRLQDAAGNPFHGHSGTKSFPSFTSSDAAYTPEGLLVWSITRAQNADDVVISSAHTRICLASKKTKDQAYGQPVIVPANDRTQCVELGGTFDQMFGALLDYSQLELLQLQ